MAKFNQIILHWTAGAYMPNKVDFEHYHFLIDGNGAIHTGKYKPEDNLNCKDGRYAAHTGGFNTGRIGVAMCGMDEYESPSEVGKYPITKKQCEATFKFLAELCIQYDISVESVKTHYEIGKLVETGKLPKDDLTEKNIGKIDITYLPYYNPFLKPNEIGDFIRGKIRWYMKKIQKGMN